MPAREVPLGDVLEQAQVDDYTEFCWNRVDPQVRSMGRLHVLKWAVAKLNEEQTELAKPLLMQEYHLVEYDQTELWDEAGDVVFCVAVIAKALGLPLLVLMEKNRLKLEVQSRDYQSHLAQKYGDRYKGHRPDDFHYRTTEKREQHEMDDTGRTPGGPFHGPTH